MPFFHLKDTDWENNVLLKRIADDFFTTKHTKVAQRDMKDLDFFTAEGFKEF